MNALEAKLREADRLEAEARKLRGEAHRMASDAAKRFPTEKGEHMSYSFSVRAASRAAAKEMIDAELAKVVASQPAHAADSAQASAAAHAFVDVLPEPGEAQDVCASVSGSLGWRGVHGGDDYAITSASTSVSASLQAKQA